MSEPKQQQPKKPSVQYRVQLQKRIEINRSYKQRRNQAIALRILSYGLLGKKRYQNIYLTCSLNCLFFALKIANVVHSRVAGLAMIVKFQHLDVIEYYSQEFEGKSYANKKYSRIVIKLTKNPSQEDKKQPGYNQGLNAVDIHSPLTLVIETKNHNRNNMNRNQKQYRNNNRDNNNYNDRRGKNYDNRNQDRRPNRKYRDEDETKPPRKTYNEKKKYNNNTQEKVQQGPKSQYIRGATKSRGGSNNIGTRQDNRGDRQPKSRYQDE